MIRLANPADVRAFVGNDMPEDWCIERRVVGYAMEDGGEVVALGIVTWDSSGRAWGWFSKRARVSPFLMHRKASQIMALLRQVGEPSLHAICNEAIPGAAMWLERLGFAPGEMTEAGQVWIVDLATPK